MLIAAVIHRDPIVATARVRDALAALVIDSRPGTPVFVGALLDACLAAGIIDLAPAALAATALRGHCPHAAAVLLERQLLSGSGAMGLISQEDPSPRRGAKRIRPMAAVGTEVWGALTQLYSALGDGDLVRASVTSAASHVPLLAEVGGAAAQTDPSSDSVLKCEQAVAAAQASSDPHAERIARLLLADTAAQLLSWDALEQAVSVASPGALPTEVAGTMRSSLLLRTALAPAGERDPAHMQAASRALLDDAQAVLSARPGSAAADTAARLLRMEGGELAAALVAAGRVEEAQTLISRCWAEFAGQWAALHPLATQARGAALRRARVLAELDEFVFSAMRARLGEAEGLRSVLQAWQTRFPSRLHDRVDVWSQLLLARDACMPAAIGLARSAMDVRPVYCCDGVVRSC
jgi:hypothetical protein